MYKQEIIKKILSNVIDSFTTTELADYFFYCEQEDYYEEDWSVFVETVNNYFIDKIIDEFKYRQNNDTDEDFILNTTEYLIEEIQFYIDRM